jgi:bifunctional DNA-binding transcriptional regulator/antitoxin component of YhaV-PrlF toxin-antitoxin module
VRKVLDVKPGQEVEWYVVKDRVMLKDSRRVAKPAKFLTSQIKLDIDAVKACRRSQRGVRVRYLDTTANLAVE